MFPTFDEVYSKVQKEEQEIKSLRTKYKGKWFRKLIIFFIMWAITLYIFTASEKYGGFCLLVAFISSGGFFGAMISNVRTFKYEYKKIAIQAVLKRMFEMAAEKSTEEDYTFKVRYAPDKYTRSSTIGDSGLVDYFNRSEGEDLTKGRIGLTDFEFSEVKLVERTVEKDRDGKKKEQNLTVFEGTVFVADFHKDFEAETYLLGGRVFKGTRNHFKRKKAYEIELEDMEFNKKFTTMTTNDIQARYVLPINLMEKIVAFTKRAHGTVSISFVDSKMYVFTKTKKDLFEGRFWRSNDYAALKNVYNEFITYFDIVEEFTLNRRIWGKS